MEASEAFFDHYAVLAVSTEASPEQVRSAFRARILEVHPDKTSKPVDSRRLQQVMRAFEILGNAELREMYDRSRRIRRRNEEPESSLPHVTESERPIGKARAILYMLVHDRVREAFDRLVDLGDDPVAFLDKHLERGEFVDAAFLLAEDLEDRKLYTEALHWFQEIIRREGQVRYPRPCFPEVLERTKRLLIQRLQSGLEPRVALEYLRRAEVLGVTRVERFEIEKKRAHCYLEMDMRVEAARHLQEALNLQPNPKGVQKLVAGLGEYL